MLNLVFAFLGNAVGAGVFVGGAYWYLYGRAAETSGEQAAGTTDGTASSVHRSPRPSPVNPD